jgi:hypothetical protein
MYEKKKAKDECMRRRKRRKNLWEDESGGRMYEKKKAEEEHMRRRKNREVGRGQSSRGEMGGSPIIKAAEDLEETVENWERGGGGG